MLSNRPPRAVLYLRVSTPQQVNEGNSLDVQDQALHAKAEREGWDVVRVFSDEGFSAHDRDIQRNGIEDAVACAERHLSTGDFFGVYNISRFSRRTSHGSQLRDRLETAGIVIVDVNMYYDYSPLGNMMFNSMLANAQFFSDNMVRESRLAMDQQRKKGRWLGKAPFGYRVSHNRNLASLLPIADEQEVVVEVFKKIMLGVPKADVAGWMAENEHIKAKFRNVTPATEVKRIDRMVRMHVYQGIIKTKSDEEPIQGDFLPLVSTDLFQAARLVLGLVPKAVRAYSARLDEFPFKRVILCGQCGAKFTGYYVNKTKYGTRYPRYECMDCRKEWIALSDAHEQVMDSLGLLGVSQADLTAFQEAVEALAREQVANHLDRRAGLQRDLKELEGSRDSYLDAFVYGRIAKEDYERKVRGFDLRKEELEARLSAVPILGQTLIDASLRELNRMLSDPKECWENTPPQYWNDLARVFFASGLVCSSKKLRTRSFLREIGGDGPSETQNTKLAPPA